MDLRPELADLQAALRGRVLGAENRHELYIPKGMAHGFQTLEDETEVFYQISEFYAPSPPAATAGTIPPSRSPGPSR